MAGTTTSPKLLLYHHTLQVSSPSNGTSPKRILVKLGRRRAHPLGYLQQQQTALMVSHTGGQTHEQLSLQPPRIGLSASCIRQSDPLSTHLHQLHPTTTRRHIQTTQKTPLEVLVLVRRGNDASEHKGHILNKTTVSRLGDESDQPNKQEQTKRVGLNEETGISLNERSRQNLRKKNKTK